MKRMMLATTLVLATVTTASGHSKSKETIPANDATVNEVTSIELRFDEPMRVTAVSVSGPEGAVEIARETGLDPVTEFRATPPSEMPSGAYTVQWRGLSADGHPMQGQFGFTIAD